MSNSDYEDREVAYLTEIWTYSEPYERSRSNPEDQEEDHDDKESPTNKNQRPPSERMGKMDRTKQKNKQRNRSRNTEQI